MATFLTFALIAIIGVGIIFFGVVAFLVAICNLADGEDPYE